MNFITTIEELNRLYDQPGEAALKKVTRQLTPLYKKWIMRSKFCVLSSVGKAGTDGSPRGDDGPVVKILDSKTLALPDWQGNNRIDTLRNIIEDGRVSLMFMVAGSNNVIRINGSARVTTDAALLKMFEQHGHHPKVVIQINVNEVYFQCARALIRAQLWNGENDSKGLPTPGAIVKEITNGSFDGETYDKNWPDRAKKTMW